MTEPNTTLQNVRRWALEAVIVIVVVLLVLVLIDALLELGAKEMAKYSQCGKKQSQIVGALIAYSVNENMDGIFPSDLAVDPKFSGSQRGRMVTVRMMELLAAAQALPNQQFKCPSAAMGGPSKTLKPDPRNPSSAWGWGDGYGVSYALDWAAPGDPSASRVIGADREIRAHGDFVMTIFGDSHVARMKLVQIPQRTADALITEALIESPIKTGTTLPPDDDIYSTEGDAGDPLTPGKGDPLRAWVK